LINMDIVWVHHGFIHGFKWIQYGFLWVYMPLVWKIYVICCRLYIYVCVIVLFVVWGILSKEMARVENGV
jgi:hypothetical protein